MWKAASHPLRSDCYPKRSGATVAIKIGGTEDPDGIVELLEGANVIEVEVTDEDGVISKTYT